MTFPPRRSHVNQSRNRQPAAGNAATLSVAGGQTGSHGGHGRPEDRAARIPTGNSRRPGLEARWAERARRQVAAHSDRQQPAGDAQTLPQCRSRLLRGHLRARVPDPGRTRLAGRLRGGPPGRLVRETGGDQGRPDRPLSPRLGLRRRDDRAPAARRAGSGAVVAAGPAGRHPATNHRARDLRPRPPCGSGRHHARATRQRGRRACSKHQHPRRLRLVGVRREADRPCRPLRLAGRPVARRAVTPREEPCAQPIAPEGSPNILYIVLDDVGFSAMEPYGGLIETPNINRIADAGLVYTNFHTTALCSPTRSCLLTGRNHTTNSMASITEAAAGFPNSSGHIPFECGNVAEVLGERGWNTYAVGKWHLTPEDEMNLASVRRQWPLGRGFERFYGFLGAETNQWYPDLVHDNHTVEQPATPEEGYHFTTDITDRALSFIRDAKAVAPDKPFLLYYCPGAYHAPHHAPTEWSNRYAGKFDMGYEELREQTLARQKQMGIVPHNTQ